MIKPLRSSGTRQHILRSALRHFATHGYAATSVQQIVRGARVSKPALYYYFGDKAGLFRALVDHAHEERHRLMREAAEGHTSVAAKFEAIVAAVFEFSIRNQELMRLSFATAFAACDDTPGHAACMETGKRNFDFIRSLVQDGQATGELDPNQDPNTLAMGIYGQMNIYEMIRLMAPGCPLNHGTAVNIVKLFMKGAAAPPRKPARNRSGVKPSGLPSRRL